MEDVEWGVCNTEPCSSQQVHLTTPQIAMSAMHSSDCMPYVRWGCPKCMAANSIAADDSMNTDIPACQSTAIAMIHEIVAHTSSRHHSICQPLSVHDGLVNTDVQDVNAKTCYGRVMNNYTTLRDLVTIRRCTDLDVLVQVAAEVMEGGSVSRLLPTLLEIPEDVVFDCTSNRPLLDASVHKPYIFALFGTLFLVLWCDPDIVSRGLQAYLTCLHIRSPYDNGTKDINAEKEASETFFENKKFNEADLLQAFHQHTSTQQANAAHRDANIIIQVYGSSKHSCKSLDHTVFQLFDFGLSTDCLRTLLIQIRKSPLSSNTKAENFTFSVSKPLNFPSHSANLRQETESCANSMADSVHVLCDSQNGLNVYQKDDHNDPDSRHCGLKIKSVSKSQTEQSDRNPNVHEDRQTFYLIKETKALPPEKERHEHEFADLKLSKRGAEMGSVNNPAAHERPGLKKRKGLLKQNMNTTKLKRASAQCIAEEFPEEMVDLKLEENVEDQSIQQKEDDKDVALKLRIACNTNDTGSFRSYTLKEKLNERGLVDFKIKLCNTSQDTNDQSRLKQEGIQNEMINLTRKYQHLGERKMTEQLSRDTLGHKNGDYILALRDLTWIPCDQLPIPPTVLTVGVIFEPMDNVLKGIAEGEQQSPRVTMQYELLRMCTLRNYPREDKPYIIRIAQAGFYYASDGDEVVCYVCGLRKRNWRQSDVPMDVHRRISPDCRFLTHNSEVNVPVPRSSTPDRVSAFLNDLDTEQASSELGATNSPLDISERPASSALTSNEALLNASRASVGNCASTSLDDPKYPHLAIRSRRRSSFVNWPDNTGQNPETLADAGFYYADIGDCIRCFYCGIGLRHWTAEDDVWIEHARWSRNCKYLLQVKGEEFANLVHLAIQYTQDAEEQPAATNGASGNTPPSDEIDHILRSNAAQSVLEMGYQPRIIKKAIERVLRHNGATGITAEMIMEKVLEIEDEAHDNAAVQTRNVVTTHDEVRTNPEDDITNGQALAQLDISSHYPSVNTAGNETSTTNSHTAVTVVPSIVFTNNTITANLGTSTSVSIPERQHNGPLFASTTTPNGETVSSTVNSFSLNSTMASPTANSLSTTNTVPANNVYPSSLVLEQQQQTNGIPAPSAVGAASGLENPTGGAMKSDTTLTHGNKRADTLQPRGKIHQTALQNSEVMKHSTENRQQQSDESDDAQENQARAHAHNEHSTNGLKKLREENEKLKGQATCKVCMDKLVSVVFLPCGHLVTCTDCAPAMRKCPVCRTLIKGTVKAFI